MDYFFYAGSFFDAVELKELLLRRYHTLSFVDDMDIEEFVEFVKLAREKDMEDRLYQHWCAMLPQMAEYKAFGEFKDMMTGANLDLRPTSEIIKEIEELHKQKGD